VIPIISDLDVGHPRLDSNAASRTMAVRRHASVSDTLRW